MDSTATQAIVVQTGDGSRSYDGTASGTGLSYTLTGNPADYSTTSLSFLTSSANVGTSALLDNGNPTSFVSGATTYAVAYYKGNYSITAKSITASYTGSNKVYDGTTTGSVSGTSSGVITADSALVTGSIGDGKPYSGEDVSLTGTATGTFSSKDVAAL